MKNRFASFASIVEACEEALSKHGLTFSQPIELTPSGPALKTVLIHCESGQTLESLCPLFLSENKGINTMQALGSSITYARRYSLESLLGILREDDDAEGAYPRQREQARSRRPPLLSRPLARQLRPRHHRPPRPRSSGRGARRWPRRSAATSGSS